MSESNPETGPDYVAWLEQLRVDLAETVGGVLLRGARPVPVGITEGATTRPLTSPGALVGFALKNESDEDNVSVRVLFYDGAGADADVILPVELAPGESVRDWFSDGGIGLVAGLSVDYDGPISGSVFLRGAE